MHRGSVFSALSSAHWALSQLDAAINYMQQDLAVAKSLGDTAGECRAHGNLGAAYFSQGSYKDALTAHRYQLVLAMKCKVSWRSWCMNSSKHNDLVSRRFKFLTTMSKRSLKLVSKDIFLVLSTCLNVLFLRKYKTFVYILYLCRDPLSTVILSVDIS